MPPRPSRNAWAVIALLGASLLISLINLADPSALPPEALVWTGFAALAHLALIPLAWRGYRWAFIGAAVLAALNVIVTSFNPVDPYYLTHWDDPIESFLVVLEGYALPLPLIFFAFRAHRETRRAQ
ncbi:MAG: hypothetical protein HY320_10275 [Armatimonadetes bacterium]|nr:hypothetical protein [Armatimonadota bacterium]